MSFGELFHLARDMAAEQKGEALDKPPPLPIFSAQTAIAEEWVGVKGRGLDQSMP